MRIQSAQRLTRALCCQFLRLQLDSGSPLKKASVLVLHCRLMFGFMIKVEYHMLNLITKRENCPSVKKKK